MTFSSLVPAGAESNVASPGRYVALDQGEKVVNAATSIAGTSFFGTNRPSPPVGNACYSNLGIAKTYAMPLFCVSPTGSELVGGGLPPSPVSGVVTIGSGASARRVVFVIGAPEPEEVGHRGLAREPVDPRAADPHLLVSGGQPMTSSWWPFHNWWNNSASLLHRGIAFVKHP